MVVIYNVMIRMDVYVMLMNVAYQKEEILVRVILVIMILLLAIRLEGIPEQLVI